MQGFEAWAKILVRGKSTLGIFCQKKKKRFRFRKCARLSLMHGSTAVLGEGDYCILYCTEPLVDNRKMKDGSFLEA